MSDYPYIDEQLRVEATNKFPSLNHHFSPMHRGDAMGVGGLFVLFDFVEEGCIDKETIKAAIKNTRELMLKGRGLPEGGWALANLEKELGL